MFVQSIFVSIAKIYFPYIYIRVSSRCVGHAVASLKRHVSGFERWQEAAALVARFIPRLFELLGYQLVSRPLKHVPAHFLRGTRKGRWRYFAKIAEIDADVRTPFSPEDHSSRGCDEMFTSSSQAPRTPHFALIPLHLTTLLFYWSPARPRDTRGINQKNNYGAFGKKSMRGANPHVTRA